MSLTRSITRALTQPLTRGMTAPGAGGSLPNTMVVELASGYLYARTPWDATYDAVQRITVTAVTASATANGCVQPSGIKLIPIATARGSMVTAYNAAATAQTIAGQTDDAPPCKYNNTFIGGNHGANVSKKITCTAHGKVAADIGSLWTNGSVQFRIIAILDANTLLMLSANTGHAERWSFNTTLAAGTLTHVSGATNTGDIVFTGPVTWQIFPCVQNHVRTVKLNGSTTVTVDGVYDCNHVTVEESYGIHNVASMLDYIVAGMPWASAPALNHASIATQVQLEHVYTVRDNGSLSMAGRFENLQTVDMGTNDGYISFIQSQPIYWDTPSSEQIWFYVPRVNTVGSLAAEPTQNITTSVPLTDYIKTTWTSATNPPDRMVQFVKSSGGVNKRGYATGYSRLSGAGADMDNYVVKSGYITAARKMYTHILTKLAPVFGAPASTLPVNSVVAATAYRIPYNLAAIPEATTAAVRLTDAGAEVILDFHTNVSAYAVPVPAKLNGKTVTIVDSNGNLTLDSAVVTAGAITVTVTGSYGAAVLQVA